ncbi:MAG: sigma 54-interacting transcriptional regulator [Leptospirales bacterium]
METFEGLADCRERSVFDLRHYERMDLSVPVLFRTSSGGERKGVLTNLSLTGCFIRPLRRTDLEGWIRLQILSPSDPPVSGQEEEAIQTWGFVTRQENEGFALHFNWIERENLRKFGELLLRHDSENPSVRKLLEVNESSFQFLGATPSGHEVPSRSEPLGKMGVEDLLRKSWSSFLEHSPAHFFDGMIEWISSLVIETDESDVQDLERCADWFFLGESPQVHEVIQKIRVVAPSTLPILLLGETGVGKEMFARLCHELGSNRPGPFLPVNCGAIPMELAESLFFGHEKGSFSGAASQSKGYLEAASDGTLFLDEVGELPLPLQVKLLRILQERTFCRLGSVREIPFSARIVCATNKDLKEEVRKGAFREDLFYRLDGLSLLIQPLRERSGDIVPMAGYFLKKISLANNLGAKTIGREAGIALQSYSWPGNVRELHNVIYRACVVSDKSEIREEDLGLPLEYSGQTKPTLRELREIFEKEILVESLLRHNGNVGKVAEELEISKPSVYHFIKKHNIQATLPRS